MKAILFTAVVALCAQAFAGDNWPQFRGPNASGISTNTSLPGDRLLVRTAARLYCFGSPTLTGP